MNDDDDLVGLVEHIMSDPKPYKDKIPHLWNIQYRGYTDESWICDACHLRAVQFWIKEIPV